MLKNQKLEANTVDNEPSHLDLCEVFANAAFVAFGGLRVKNNLARLKANSCYLPVILQSFYMFH